MRVVLRDATANGPDTLHLSTARMATQYSLEGCIPPKFTSTAEPAAADAGISSMDSSVLAALAGWARVKLLISPSVMGESENRTSYLSIPRGAVGATKRRSPHWWECFVSVDGAATTPVGTPGTSAVWQISESRTPTMIR